MYFGVYTDRNFVGCLFDRDGAFTYGLQVNALTTDMIIIIRYDILCHNHYMKTRCGSNESQRFGPVYHPITAHFSIIAISLVCRNIARQHIHSLTIKDNSVILT